MLAEAILEKTIIEVPDLNLQLKSKPSQKTTIEVPDLNLQLTSKPTQCGLAQSVYMFIKQCFHVY